MCVLRRKEKFEPAGALRFGFVTVFPSPGRRMQYTVDNKCSKRTVCSFVCLSCFFSTQKIERFGFWTSELAMLLVRDSSSFLLE